MNPEQFCYWLQGHMELADEHNELNCVQVQKIKDHLATVFTKITPTRKEHSYCADQKQTPLLIDDLDGVTKAATQRATPGNAFLTEEGVDTSQVEEQLDKYFNEHNKRLCELNPNTFTLGPATFEPKPWPST